MIKRLTFFNLIYGTAEFFLTINAIGRVEYLYSFGLILTIFYNWETLKLIKGQKKKLMTINLVIGSFTILFALFLIAFNTNIYFSATGDKTNGLIFITVLDYIFALTVLTQTIMSIKRYNRLIENPANGQHSA